MRWFLVVGWCASLASAVATLNSAVAATAVTLTPSLTDLPPTWQLAGDWDTTGTWQAGLDGLTGSEAEASLLATPHLARGTAAVTITPLRRMGADGWATAALRLVDSPQRYWQLDLVEDPGGEKRRLELIEMLDGGWQAQNEPATRLVGQAEGPVDWAWGQSYRVELDWSAERITGRVKPVGAAAWQWQVTFPFPPGVEAVKRGRPGLATQAAAARWRDLVVSGEADTARRVTGTRAVLLAGEGVPNLPQWAADAKALRALASSAGYEVREVAPTALATALDYAQDGLLLAPSLEQLPVAAFRAIAAWVKAGGDLLATGGEPFKTPLYRAADGRWLTAADLLGGLPVSAVALDPARPVPLNHGTNDPAGAWSLDFGQPGPDAASKSLRLAVANLSGWFTASTPEFAQSPFGQGQSLTVVWVKGTPGQATTLEWKEVDKSRWIATLPLTATWTRHVLQPADFRFWADGSPVARQNTTFNPAQARILSFGPAFGFGSTHDGPVELWLGPVGLATTPGLLEAFQPPVIETLSPWYKQTEQTIRGRSVRVATSRPRGLSLAPELDGRFHYLDSGEASGVSVYVTAAGARLTWVPSTDLAASPGGPLGPRLQADLAAGRSGVALLNAGPAQVVALTGETPTVGARLLNASALAQTATVRWSFDRGGVQGEVVRTVELPPDSVRGVVADLPALPPPGDGRLTVRVSVGATEVDHLQAPWRVMAPVDSRHADRRVKVQGDRFAVGGRPVFLNGVNYWPRNVTGMEPGRYHSGWLLPHNYDPDVIEADLALLQQLGLNLVSIQYGSLEMARPLRDFLARCRAHGIWVNLYTGSASGLGCNPERDRRLLTEGGVIGNDAVAMLDLHWEPHLGDHGERRKWDGEWRAWLDEQWGSAARAEQALGVALPRENGEVTNPADDQLANDGAWRPLVAAYRRFADDLISRRYGRVCRELKRLDPDLLLGVRTGYGGTGRPWPAKVMAYDLTAGAAHLDFTSPEGYGMPAQWEAARSTGLVTSYGRWAGNGKPVFWAEFGASIGPRNGSETSRSNQTLIWESTLRMCGDSGAAAAAGWWWPGGWRVDESSDFGVLDPDGSPRESVVRAARLGQHLPAAGEGQPVRIVIDRDADARGLAGLWPKHEAAWLAARQQGRPVELVTAGTGSSTRTMPRLQISGRPWREGCPPQSANAEVAAIEASWPGGAATVENGATLTVPRGAAVTLTVRLLNSGEATWDGCRLRAGQTPPALAVVPRFGTTQVVLAGVAVNAPSPVVGRVETAEGVPFGEALRLTLTPR